MNETALGIANDLREIVDEYGHEISDELAERINNHADTLECEAYE